MARLQLNHVSKVYHHNSTAVKDFNLMIDDEEFIVFVGPSGCGKSTTLRMIAGLEEISEGDLYIDGKRMNHVPVKDRDIAMVFQNYALYPHMNVFDNMAFGLKMRKVPKDTIKRRVEEAARILGLEPYLNRKPKELSGGQCQRIALGRAIVRDAKVFLMDEPLSNLDAKLRVQMRAEISKLHHRLKTTTIYVTHDQIEAMTMATRLVVMKDGIIQQVGTPTEVYNHPENMFVAGFIGSPAMNFLKGVIKENYFVSENERLKLPNGQLAFLKNKGCLNQEIYLGIRPENIHDASTDSDTASSAVNAKIEVVEHLGSETILYSSIGQQNYLTQVDSSSTIQMGDTVPLYFDMKKAYFFNAKTSDRIK